MARHLMHGHWSTFWGQNYGGSREAIVTVAIFRVADGTLQLSSYPLPSMRLPHSSSGVSVGERSENGLRESLRSSSGSGRRISSGGRPRLSAITSRDSFWGSPPCSRSVSGRRSRMDATRWGSLLVSAVGDAADRGSRRPGARVAPLASAEQGRGPLAGASRIRVRSPTVVRHERASGLGVAPFHPGPNERGRSRPQPVHGSAADGARNPRALFPGVDHGSDRRTAPLRARAGGFGWLLWRRPAGLGLLLLVCLSSRSSTRSLPTPTSTEPRYLTLPLPVLPWCSRGLSADHGSWQLESLRLSCSRLSGWPGWISTG
jgi:hypothetical protein